MLADKKINDEEADKLLEKLSNQAAAEAKPENSSSSASSNSSSAKKRYLRIAIDKPGENQVNVRVPIAFARSGSHLLAVLPTRVREKLSEQGIDLSEAGVLDPKKWDALSEDSAIEIERGNGKKVRVFCE